MSEKINIKRRQRRGANGRGTPCEMDGGKVATRTSFRQTSRAQ
jgi:hypothetical protein